MKFVTGIYLNWAGVIMFFATDIIQGLLNQLQDFIYERRKELIHFQAIYSLAIIVDNNH